MNNCELWKNAETAERMYQKYLSLLNDGDKLISFAQWMYKGADFALQVNVGDILQYKNGRDEEDPVIYIRVVSYDRAGDGANVITFRRINFQRGGGTTTYGGTPEQIFSRDSKLSAYQFKWPEIPKDFMDLIAPKCPVEAMKDKCPFKDEYKEPVPPCMKEEDDD